MGFNGPAQPDPRDRVHALPKYWSEEANRTAELDQSMRSLEHYNDACWFRLVRFETRERRVAPTGEIYDFTSLAFHFGRLGGLQHVEAATVQEEGMIPINAIQLL